MCFNSNRTHTKFSECFTSLMQILYRSVRNLVKNHTRLATVQTTYFDSVSACMYARVNSTALHLCCMSIEHTSVARKTDHKTEMKRTQTILNYQEHCV